MTTALIGATGQLGTDLLEVLAGDVVPLSHSAIELTDPDSVEESLDRIRPELVINTAAYNLVDRAEEEMEQAFAVNAFGPACLAAWCRGHDATLVHFSTDYVFGTDREGEVFERERRTDARENRTGARKNQTGGSETGAGDTGNRSAGSDAGTGEQSDRNSDTPCETGPGSEPRRATPWSELDRPSPRSVYAASKLSGEHLVQAGCPRHFVIRTCGLYGLAATRGAGKGNFVETMLRLGRERDELSVVNDQHCTPTATIDLAEAVSELIATKKYGLYHATNSGQTTWYDLAGEIFRLSGIDVRVQPISSAEFGAKAARPPFSVLSTTRLEAAIGRPLPPWQDALQRYLDARQTTVGDSGISK